MLCSSALPQDGSVWFASHGRHLSVCRPPGTARTCSRFLHRMHTFVSQPALRMCYLTGRDRSALCTSLDCSCVAEQQFLHIRDASLSTPADPSVLQAPSHGQWRSALRLQLPSHSMPCAVPRTWPAWTAASPASDFRKQTARQLVTAEHSWLPTLLVLQAKQNPRDEARLDRGSTHWRNGSGLCSWRTSSQGPASSVTAIYPAAARAAAGGQLPASPGGMRPARRCLRRRQCTPMAALWSTAQSLVRWRPCLPQVDGLPLCRGS